MRQHELHVREDVVPDPPLEDGRCELLGGDPGVDFWSEELVERMASTEEAAEGFDGQLIDDVKHKLAREFRERHDRTAGSAVGMGSEVTGRRGVEELSLNGAG